MEWNSSLYDNKHDFVAEYGKGLLEFIPKNNEQTILDLGCGTGTLTALLVGLCSKVVGVDSSQNMIDKAKKQFENIEFLVCDALASEMADSYSPNGEKYTGYLNIRNPFIIDAKGEKWSRIAIDDDIKKLLDNYGSSAFKEGGKWRTKPADIAATIEAYACNICFICGYEGMAENHTNSYWPCSLSYRYSVYDQDRADGGILRM